ncbi:MAG: hypothetical protein SV765_13465 [Pseudomonadota bacterium]|nr:hypothetical protein [Pseudomonadota bacterium]
MLDGPAVTVIAHERAAEDMAWTRLPTARPEVRFADQLTVTLGESSVQLQYYGPNNGRGSVSMRFMPANVMFVVDWVLVGRMPYRNFQGYDVHGVIRSTRALLAQPRFDVFVGGHGDVGTWEDVKFYLGYMEALYAGVRGGMLAGKTLADLQRELRFPKYSGLRMYQEWLPENIAGVYDMLINDAYFHLREGVQAEP